MPLNRALFKKQLQEGLNTVFGLEYKRWPEEWRAIYDVERSQKAYEEDVLVTGFGAAPVKAEGAGVAYDTASEAWVAKYLHETIALAFAITEEAEEDGLYGSLGAKYARALARSHQHTKEVKGANILNNGHTSGTGGDGIVLFATNHPLVGGGTLSNKLATAADLSETSLEDACIQISQFTDDRGIPIATRPKGLCVPPELRFIANRILFSPGRPGTADNDLNALNNLGAIPGGVSVNHRLTDADAWYIKTDCPDGLKHFVRVRMQRGMEGEFESGNLRYKARQRYVFGWTDPRGAFSSEGAA